MGESNKGAEEGYKPENVSADEFAEAMAISAEHSEFEPEQVLVTSHDGIEVVYLPEVVIAKGPVPEAYERRMTRDVVTLSILGGLNCPSGMDMVRVLMFGPVTHYDA